ncbi:MAG: hypothetical protein M0Z68_05170 [Gammaproteobacteria bacterium]|nr:hypothetical protein [Gammaproteobacteria bacterium]
MSIHEILFVTLALAFLVALAFAFLGVVRFDSLPMVVSGFVSLIVIFVFAAYSAKPGHPSWSAMRPVVKEAATFHNRPPAIAADWRRLQAGHRLTDDQWFAFRHWVNREQEIRARRVVERIVADHLRARTRKVPHSRTSKAR